MANKVEREGFLLVPSRFMEVPESFVTFLWEQEVPAFLCKLGGDWLSLPESGETGLGLRVSPGSC